MKSTKQPFKKIFIIRYDFPRQLVIMLFQNVSAAIFQAIVSSKATAGVIPIQYIEVCSSSIELA